MQTQMKGHAGASATSQRCISLAAPLLARNVHRSARSLQRANSTSAGSSTTVVREATTVKEHPAFDCLAKMRFHGPGWAAVKTEAQFMAMVDSEVAAGRCPAHLVPGFKDFYSNYRNTLVGSGVPGFTEEVATTVQAAIMENILLQISDPFEFQPFHQAVLEPFNYFEFGQGFTAPLINFSQSLVGHMDRLDRIEALLKEGHNVVLLANHQTEVDPAVWSHLLLKSHPKLATEIVYVAGDRVVTDPIFKPLSMGRNLFCVHSKKHINDVPELKAKKQETNRRTLSAMQRRFAEGGALVWVAPSGGRDRPKADGKWTPDPFDSTVVDLMRNLLTRAKVPGHLIPMAMYSYPMMPPPTKVEQAIGERRVTSYEPIGISICEELRIEDESLHPELTNLALQAVRDEFARLEAAIHDHSLCGTAYVPPAVAA